MDIQDVKPQYSFGTPDENVILANDEAATISTDKKQYTGKSIAVLHLGRKPCIKFTMPFDGDMKSAWLETFSLYSESSDDVSLTLNDRHITIEKGYICNFGVGKNTVIPEQKETPSISWTAFREPFTVLGNESTEIDALVFHLLNCPALSAPNNKEATGKKGWSAISIITLKWNEWTIEIKSIPKLHEIVTQVRDNGGFGLTHIGIIRKEGNQTFKIEDMALLRHGFSWFMDFVVGRSCWPCFCVGFNSDIKVYEDWGTIFSTWSSPMTWGTGSTEKWKASETLEVLFPLFMDLFCVDQTKAALCEAVAWYRSITEPGRPLIDQSLILLQAGIERLSYEYTVNRKKLIHKTGFKNLRASDRFRMLFSSFGIPLEIPGELAELTGLAKKLNWEDIPHSLTEIRNAMVHPEHARKEQITDVYYDAWRISIEYFELSVLAFCGYAGKYYSRIKGKNINVPWKKDGSFCEATFRAVL